MNLKFEAAPQPHPMEGFLLQHIEDAGGNKAVVDEARKIGMSWTSIFAIIIQYGTQAWAVIQQMIDAFKAGKVSK